jgi:recombination protein RecA
VPAEIDALIRTINTKQKAEVLVPGSRLRRMTYQRGTTGSLTFDVALGGGWPLNAWNEIIGNESSGKTTIILKALAAHQQRNPAHHTLWIASEDFDPEWAMDLGVDVDRMTFVMTNVMEPAYDAALAVMKERAVDAVVLDSYPALVPSDEDEKSMLELTVGRGAYFTNKFMRKSYDALTRSITEYDRPCLCLFVNQWRERIGVMFGDPRTTPGGKGKNYSFLTRIEVGREEWVKGTGGVKVGQVIKIKCVKNKTAPPQREGSVDFYFDDGKLPKGSYDTIKQVHAIALASDVLEQRGGWYYFAKRQWQGGKAVLEDMQNDPLLVAAMDNAVRHHLLGEPIETTATDAPTKRRSIKRSA